MCFLRGVFSFSLEYDGRKRISSFRNAVVIYDMRVIYGYHDLHENLVGKKKKGIMAGQEGSEEISEFILLSNQVVSIKDELAARASLFCSSCLH